MHAALQAQTHSTQDLLSSMGAEPAEAELIANILQLTPGDASLLASPKSSTVPLSGTLASRIAPSNTGKDFLHQPAASQTTATRGYRAPPRSDARLRVMDAPYDARDPSSVVRHLCAAAEDPMEAAACIIQLSRLASLPQVVQCWHSDVPVLRWFDGQASTSGELHTAGAVNAVAVALSTHPYSSSLQVRAPHST